MHAKDTIRHGLDMSEMIVNNYLGDLSDGDLMLRPVPGMNHIAWQVGHLISSERAFTESVQPGSCPPLPAGFDDAHNKDACKSDDPKKFRTKAEYLDLWKKQRAATKAVLESLPEAKLDEPSAERFRKFVPTVGAVLNMGGLHPMMHVGQWVAVRRQVGKPVVI